MTIEDLINTKREAILRSAARHGAVNVRVFGSFARGEADERSDLDILVDMEPGRSLLDLGALWRELNDEVGMKVDVVTEKGLRKRIRERVLKEAVPLVRDDRERLLDILEAIGHIEKYAGRGKEDFERDELIQNWMVRHIQIIGEAARTLSIEFRIEHSDLPWPDIIAMRHILVHEYFGIDIEIVWRVVVGDLPIIKLKIEAILGVNPD